MRYSVLFLIVLIFTGCSSQKEKDPPKPNILFISIDDLRAELGCYGKDYIKSPNLDKLASEGILFTKHFAQVPTCGASRYSMLTGKLPRNKNDLLNDASVINITHRPKEERPMTFIKYLRQNGYYTVGIGKISHYPDGYVYKYLEPKSNVRELPDSWDEMLFDSGKWGTGHNAFFGFADGSNRNAKKNMVKPYEMAEVSDTGYVDGLTANLAIEKLRELKEKGKPFFLGVGFFKPHLPFNSPKKYWDMYDEEKLPLAPVRKIPENTDIASLHNSGEFNSYRLGDEKASLKGSVSEAYERKLRHAYFACISYVDAQVGKVLDELKRLGLDKNTIVIVWGDHGWHLGDQLVWGKHTIFERALKSTLIVKVPNRKGGIKNENIVSSIDLYPSISELCGLEVPSFTDGKSLVPVLEGRDSTWDNKAFSYFRKGISMRTPEYHFIVYFRNGKKVYELYDHTKSDIELVNIAPDNPHLVDSLLTLWEKGNTRIYN
ncbi:MAG: sulfatase [Flavobacteriia bacterium]|nr:MAG: sulfatase [Flavobacteriia bacterium]